MTLETYVAVTALVFITGLCTGGAIVWFMVEPLLRKQSFELRFMKVKAENAEALARLLSRLETDEPFPGELRRIK